jgi:diguanylate cyclase (GGDEF)-like protein/PAS domain S-box-containing protein
MSVDRTGMERKSRRAEAVSRGSAVRASVVNNPVSPGEVRLSTPSVALPLSFPEVVEAMSADIRPVLEHSVPIVPSLNAEPAYDVSVLEDRTRYQALFQTAAVAIWEYDFSRVLPILDQLRAKNVSDFRAYLERHVEVVERCLARVTINDVNSAALRLYGAKSRSELVQGLQKVFAVEGLSAFRELLVALAQSQQHVEIETVQNTLQGRKLSVLLSLSVPPGVEGWRAVAVCCVDITARKRAESELRLAAHVFESTAEGVVIADADGTILRVNRAFSEMTGFRDEDVIGRPQTVLFAERSQPAFYEDICRVAADRGRWQGEVWKRRRDGSSYPEWLTVSGVWRDGEVLSHYISVMADVSEKKAWEEQLYQRAHFDALTGLPNRVLLRDRLSQAMAAAHRNEHCVALLFLDFDRFKSINDSLGHAAGDVFLQEQAQRLAACVRDVDTVVRLGGDEFTMLIPDLPNDAELSPGLMQLADEILYRVSKPFHIDGHEINGTASIGIAIYPQDAESYDDLLKNADSAMYHAKGLGRNNFQFYSQELNAEAVERLDLESALRHAIERNEFELWYQPKWSVRRREVVGMEALVRWRHPQKGLLSPTQFIPLAEETGLIVPIGNWVIHEACRQLKQWRDAGWANLRVSVNLSPRQFRQPDLVRKVADAIAASGLPPDGLELEITESAIMSDLALTVSTLQSLRAMGVTLSVDDFGTGYSSLNYLKQFPIYTLKIDQSFVRGMTENADDAAIVSATIQLAHSLSLNVVAEGVENEAQLDFLRGHDCEEVQGFLTGHPMAPAEFLRVLQKSRAAMLA